MRSLMERLSGKNYTELLKQNDHNWDKYVRLSELLHGVVGANDDTPIGLKLCLPRYSCKEKNWKNAWHISKRFSGQIAVIQRNGVTLRQVSG